MSEVPLETFIEQTEKLNSKLEEWKNEIRDMVTDYNTSIATIETGLARIKQSEKTFLKAYAIYIGPAVIIILFFIGVGILHVTDAACGKIEIYEFSSTFECPPDNNTQLESPTT